MLQSISIIRRGAFPQSQVRAFWIPPTHQLSFRATDYKFFCIQLGNLENTGNEVDAVRSGRFYILFLQLTLVTTATCEKR